MAQKCKKWPKNEKFYLKSRIFSKIADSPEVENSDFGPVGDLGDT